MPSRDKITALNHSFSRTKLFQLMDLKVTRMNHGKASLTLVCNKDTMSDQGSLYGGIISCAADVAIWVALLSLGHSGKVVTTDLNVHYLERFEKGRARLDAKILRHGKRLIMGEVEMFNHSKIMGAHITGTFLKS